MIVHIHEAALTSDTTISQRIDQLEKLTREIASAVNSLIQQSVTLAEKVEAVSSFTITETPATDSNVVDIEKNITPSKENQTS